MSTKGKTLVATYNNLAYAYIKLNKMDSALLYGQKAYEVNTNQNINWNYPLFLLAVIYERLGRGDGALKFYKTAVQMAFRENIMVDVVKNYIGIAAVFKKAGQSDSAILYARKAIALEKEINYKRGALEASLLLSEAFENRKINDSAFHYYKYAMAIKDSLYNKEKTQQVQSIAFKEELKERELRQKAILQQAQYRNKITLSIVLGVAVALLSLTLMLWRNNQLKQKTNSLLQQKNEQVQSALTELKATQAQLIQREKMASLGELTAGIAHEIQNPLNFVNNFSEVNKELINELKNEVRSGNSDEVINIADEIEENEEKITLHGKRADAIVKGMLQHSRVSTGEKQPTDINALVEEHLRLAYHGFKVKEKEFNTDFTTNYDAAVGKLSVVPQDIGRVLLNLFSNAFYAVHEKKRHLNGTFEPEISVSTKKVNNRVEISVKDNGTGIHEKIIDKIYQPFFTTKPTGEGTGLGLSLSYDIITKGHGGEIKVNTIESEGAEFIIQLPI